MTSRTLTFLPPVFFGTAGRLRLRVRVCLIACSLPLVRSSHRQQFGVAWRKYVVLDEPKCVIGKAPAHNGRPVLFHELAEIIRVDDSGFCPRGGENSRLEPTQVNPFLYFVGAGVQCPRE